MPVYAKSYQRFGQDQGLLRSYELLINQNFNTPSLGCGESVPGEILLEAPCDLTFALVTFFIFFSVSSLQ